ncbi:MAG: LCCL domain-containing protein [Leptospiraceae bacterium]
MKILKLLPVAALLAVVACGPDPIQITCDQSVKSLKNTVEGKTSFVVSCPSACGERSVWGTDVYTTDSSICTAARHAGVIDTDGGKVEVEVTAGQDSYSGSERNGVSTGSWNSYPGSFTVK